MQSKSPLMGITMLGALLALFTAFTRKPGDATPAMADDTRKPLEGSPAPLAPDGPGVQLLERHFGVTAKSQLDLGEQRLDVLIATLPDPFDSHLDWAFDQALDSLRRAYESAGFVIDGYTLPWSTQTREDNPDNRALRETTPGAFLFRHRTEKRLELLYVVGEVPTSGVHRLAFEAALQERDLVLALRTTQATPPDTLRLLGPFFSGSAPSLHDLVADWLVGHEQRRVDVVTGSATSAGNESILSEQDSTKETASPGTSAGSDTPWPPSRIRFRATVHPDETFLSVLENEVLPALGLDVAHVAILNENSTQYGASATASRAIEPVDEKKETKWFKLPFPMNLTSLRAAYARDWQAQPGGSASLGATKAARVELSLEEQDRTRETPRPTSPLTAPATDLAMNEIARTLESRDVKLVVLFATDVRDKLLLGAEIAKRLPDIQLLTTESNLLYLRSDFNAALRGMLVLSSYPLFVRAPDWNGQSTELQELIFPSDGAEGVYNAALLLLGRPEALADYGPPVEDGGPGNETSERSRIPPVWITAVGKGSMLPVALGRSLDETTVYPVATSREQNGYPRASDHQPIPAASILLVLVIGLALLVLCFRAVRATRHPARRLDGIIERLERTPPGTGRTSKARIESISLALHQEIYEGLLILALWSQLMPCEALLARVAFEQPAWAKALLFLASVGIPVLALIGCGIRGKRALSIASHFFAEGRCFVCCGQFRNPTERLMWSLENVARSCVVLLGAAYALWSLMLAIDVYRLGDEKAAFELFFHRATSIDEGVSPLLPLFLIGSGLAIWCLWHLRRIALLGERKTLERLSGPTEVHDGLPAQPSSEVCKKGRRACVGTGIRQLWSAAGATLWGSSTSGLPDRTADVRNRLFRVVPDTGALALLLLLVPLGGWLVYQLEPSLENLVHTRSGSEMRWFDALMATGILALLFTTAWAAYRFVVVWTSLRAYLRHCDDEPLHGAWKRLESSLGRTASLELWALRSGANLDGLLAPRWRKLLGNSASRRAEHGLEKVTWEAMERDPALHAELLTDLRTKIAMADADAGRAEPLAAWLELAHETFALELVDWIDWVLRQLRTLALFLLVSLLLTTALLSCYPFHPQSLFRLAFLFLLVGTSGSLLFVIVEMNRNPVLSRISGTDPGHLTWDRTLVMNLLLFGVLPVATLVGSQVPAVRDLLFAWVDPLLGVIAHT